MHITIDSMLRLRDVPSHILASIKDELTIKNPDYAKKMRMGLPRYAWGQEFIKLYHEKVINGQKEYIIPRGVYARLQELLGRGSHWNTTYAQRLCEPVEYPKIPVLRDYQSPAVSAALERKSGVILMPCGGGKTETALAIVAATKQPTLWITHTMDLLNQSKERAISRLGITGQQIGMIQGDNMIIGSHMTFATVQTLSKRDISEIKDRFGCVVIDECHLVFKDADKARMFESVIGQLPAYYRFGLTASEHRSDGLIETMFKVIGPKIYEVAQDDPRLMTMKPKIEFITTDFYYEADIDADGEKKMLNVQLMLKAMREDLRRNGVVTCTLRKIEEDDTCIVLGDSLDHLDQLCEMVEGWGMKAAFVCGETPKKEREQIMADMRTGKYQFLFATYQLAKLGLDIPRLNKLILATPKRDKTSIQQAVGRIMRPDEGKLQPVVYDIVDNLTPQLKNWARERLKVYKTLGCDIGGRK